MLRSTEILSHFRCNHCGGWWSIGDFEVRRAQYMTDVLYCPWCSAAHQIDDSEESECTMNLPALTMTRLTSI